MSLLEMMSLVYFSLMTLLSVMTSLSVGTYFSEMTTIIFYGIRVLIFIYLPFLTSRQSSLYSDIVVFSSNEVYFVYDVFSVIDVTSDK
jgi:hypothetical protein